jgi:phenylacetate-CoA ligase
MANAGAGLGLHAAGWLAGKPLPAALAAMKAAQWLSCDELAQRQRARLEVILRYAVSNVPFYKRHAAALGCTDKRSAADALHLFPVVRKMMLRSRLPEFIAAGVPQHRKLARMTSGSTGEPFLHYLDREAIPVIYASHLFYDSWFGLRPFDRLLRIAFPHEADRAGPGLAGARHRCAAGLKRAYEWLTQDFIPVWEVGPEQVDSVYSRLLAFRPDFILGYTSTLATAAEYLLEQGRELRAPLRGVITIGETLTPLRRKLIQAYFKAPIINRYGLREFGAWSAQNCPSSPDHFHINSEMVVLEILREDGAPAGPGESGRVVITDFFNRVMPLIRYDTGDVAVQGDGSRCDCGRGFPRFGQIEGRAVESLLTPSGKSVSSIVLGRYLREGGPGFRWSDHAFFIRHYQAIQDDSMAVRFLVVPAPGFDAERRRHLAEDLVRLLGAEVNVKVEEVVEIPLEPSGKRPLIKRRPVAGESGA